MTSPDWSSVSRRTLQGVLSRIPNPRTLLQLPLLSPSLSSNVHNPLRGTSASCHHAQLSCHNSSAVADTCCFNAPGGQLLQTQFWDTNPPTGPVDSWTIHGLWPDHCDGTFDANCDTTRAYTNITSILSAAGATHLLTYMRTYWKDYQGNDETFWEHEWSKHGTCISTLDTKCYTDYVPQQEVVDFFHTTTKLFKTLPTYFTLAVAGVVPVTGQTYTAAQIQAPLQAMHGASVILRCANGALNEVWYHFDVRGSVQTGQFVPAEPNGATSNCPASGIKYLPKSPPTSTGTPSPTTTGTSTPSPTGAPFEGKGHLSILHNGAPRGCLISRGPWYTSGTCATFHAQTDVLLPVPLTPNPHRTSDGPPHDEHLFTLKSSKGPCGFVPVPVSAEEFVEGTVGGGPSSQQRFECSKTLTTQSIFSRTVDGQLAYLNRTTFYVSKAPDRFGRVYVHSGKDGEHGVEVRVLWSAMN